MATIQICIATQAVTASPVKAVPAAAWAAVLTYRDQQKTLAVGQYGQTSSATLLSALISSLKALKRHDLPVIVALPASDVLTTFNQQTYVIWQKNDWQVDEHPVTNQELWQKLIALTDQFPDLTLTQRPATNDHRATQAAKSLKQALAKL